MTNVIYTQNTIPVAHNTQNHSCRTEQPYDKYDIAQNTGNH